MDYSVLMCVYSKENPEYLKMAIESILNQILPTNDFVIIEDGELGNELESVIRTYENTHDCIHIIRHKENKGLGLCLREGVEKCRNDVIARMDSDDYSLPERCKLQLKYIVMGYDLVGTNIDEFENTPNNIVATKKMPEKIEDILQYFKYRNPFNHPSVMFKRSSVIEAGNYHDFYRLEDYELWSRMIKNGAECCNIPISLVRMRINKAFYKRRGGKENLNSHLKLKRMLLDNKQITKIEYIKGCLLMIGRAYCPGNVKQFLYRKTLRK